MLTRLSPLMAGILAGGLLLGIFLGVLSALESAAYALYRFQQLWWGVLPLAASVGLQVGLYWHLRREVRRHLAAQTASVAATSGFSSGAMIACCLHHASDVLPILGFSTLTPFLTRYQPFFLLLGVMANLFGASLVLGHIQRLALYSPGSLLTRLVHLNLRRVRQGLIALSLVVLPLVLFTTACSRGAPSASTAIPLPPQEDSQGGLTVKVEGEFRPGEPLVLEVVLDTHQGSLDFDLVSRALLEDSQGNQYYPSSWQGTPAGGHHRSGTLTYPPLQGEPEWLRLTLKEIYGIPQRTFTWQLR